MTEDERYEFCPWCGAELIETDREVNNAGVEIAYYECIECGWACDVIEGVQNDKD